MNKTIEEAKKLTRDYQKELYILINIILNLVHTARHEEKEIKSINMPYGYYMLILASEDNRYNINHFDKTMFGIPLKCDNDLIDVELEFV